MFGIVTVLFLNFFLKIFVKKFFLFSREYLINESMDKRQIPLDMNGWQFNFLRVSISTF